MFWSFNDRRKKLSWDEQHFLIFRFCVFPELKSKAVLSTLLPDRKNAQMLIQKPRVLIVVIA